MSGTKNDWTCLVKNNNEADIDLWIGSYLVWETDELEPLNQSVFIQEARS